MRINLLFGLLFFGKVLFGQLFTEASPAPPFEPVWLSTVAFADVDSDNDLDALIAGQNDAGLRVVKLYLNNGRGIFTEKTGTPFLGWNVSAFAFSDIDKDGDQDLLLTAGNSVQQITVLFLNDGQGNFTFQMVTPFFDLSRGAVAFADVDGDNDEDLLICGEHLSGIGLTRLYINDGLGDFSEKSGTPFLGVILGSIAFADVDGDNDPDVLITGHNTSEGKTAKLYINEGNGNFIEKMGTPFEGVTFSSIAFADVDGDNDQDLLFTGETKTFDEFITKLYTNDGLGNFTEESGTPFDAVAYGSVAFSDVDGDGDQDALITGSNAIEGGVAKLYSNNGLGSFTEVLGTPFDAVGPSTVAFADIDGDNDEDLLITGMNFMADQIAKLYINQGNVPTNVDEPLRLSLDFYLYPNPSKASILEVKLESFEDGPVSIRVLDLHGKTVLFQKESNSPGKNIFSINVSSLPVGNYLVQVENGKLKGVGKFIIQ